MFKKNKKISLPDISDNFAKININKKVIKRRLNKIEGVTVRHAHKFIIKRWDNIREVQFKVVLWIIIMGLLIVATGFQLMWYKNSYQTQVASSNGTYVEAVLGPLNTLNPLFASTSAEQSVSKLLFSGILKYDDTGHLNYDLAKSVKIDSTGKIYTINIRKDVKWHDGEQLTAKDIAFTIDLIKNPATRATISGWSNVSVNLIDDYTIQFTLPTTYAAFETALTFSILPQHLLKDVSASSIRENSFSQNPVGSGPFKLDFVQTVDSNAGEKIVYTIRNDDYYNGTPKLSQFQLHVYNNKSNILKALKDNEVNAAADLLPADVETISSNNYKVTYSSTQSGVYAILNTTSSLLSDISIRRALQSATNVNAILNKLPSNTKNLYLPFTSDQVSGNLPSAPIFDLENAKKILEDDGWHLNSDGIREKDGKELKLTVVTTKSSEYESVLEVLAGQWRSLGVSITTTVFDTSDTSKNIAQSILQPRNYDVLLYNLDLGSDPDTYAYWHSSQISASGLNLANYSNAISDDALLSARSTLNNNLRNAKYITFAKQWLGDVPAIGLYQSTIQYVSNKNVTTFNSTNRLTLAVDRYDDILNWSSDTTMLFKTP